MKYLVKTGVELNKYIVTEKYTIKECLTLLNAIKPRILFVLNEKKKLVGTITEGDIRRALIRNSTLDSNIVKVTNKNPLTFKPNSNLND